VLPLSEIQERHDCRLFVLGRVALENLLNELVVLLSEVERNAGIVIRCISVLVETPSVSDMRRCSASYCRAMDREPTTKRASEATRGEIANDRHCDREAMYDGRKADLNIQGVIFDAIVAMCGRNGYLDLRRLFCRSSGVFGLLTQ
jgi:hypothetical protein